MKRFFILLFIMSFIFNLSMAEQRNIKHPDWSRNASIYEVNIRQFSPEGTFNEFEKYLPELQKMGIKIIWLMPIHPIGELNRKGTLGSYYSVKDYKEINPEFGTKEDFRRLVRRTHELGMYIIIDWVANHSAWDNIWTETNPDFYNTDPDGNYIIPVADWTDVIDLNYDNPELRKAMIDALVHWVKEFDIDGYRCDVAALVPTDFWETVRDTLDKIKPVFMLAEAHEPELHTRAFDMTYAWQYKYIMDAIASGKKDVRHLDRYICKEINIYDPDDYRMLFVTNHDENSWNGTAYERLGDGTEAFIVFTCLHRGVPLVYNGQEAGLNKALSFFEKDLIPWTDHRNREIYTTLLNLKQNNEALWNGTAGGELIRLKTSKDRHIFAFTRRKDDDKIIAIFNFSGNSQSFTIKNILLRGDYFNPLTNKEYLFSQKESFKLNAWDYLVLVKK